MRDAAKMFALAALVWCYAATVFMSWVLLSESIVLMFAVIPIIITVGGIGIIRCIVKLYGVPSEAAQDQEPTAEPALRPEEVEQVQVQEEAEPAAGEAAEAREAVVETVTVGTPVEPAPGAPGAPGAEVVSRPAGHFPMGPAPEEAQELVEEAREAEWAEPPPPVGPPLIGEGEINLAALLTGKPHTIQRATIEAVKGAVTTGQIIRKDAGEAVVTAVVIGPDGLLPKKVRCPYCPGRANLLGPFRSRNPAKACSQCGKDWAGRQVGAKKGSKNGSMVSQ